MRKSMLVKFVISGCLLAGCQIIPTNNIELTQIDRMNENTAIPSISSATTIEPSPSIISFQDKSRFEGLIATNDSCKGFCFLGITPNETGFDQAVTIIDSLIHPGLTEKKSVIETYSNSKWLFDDNVYFSIYFSNINGKVSNLHMELGGLDNAIISSGKWLAFRPDQMVASNGQPKNILFTMRTGPEGRISYSFVVLYSEGYILYEGAQSIVIPDHVLKTCPNKENQIQNLKMVSSSDSQNSQDFNGYVPIEKFLDMSTDEFYALMMNSHEDACFDLDYSKFVKFYQE